MPELAAELKMNRPFALAEEEAALAVLRTADVLGSQAAAVLKDFELTAAQYNVLRILRGSPAGLACGQISERLIAQDPDITRLLDRMEARAWIKRQRSESDRRVVLAQITTTGVALLERATPLIAAQLKKQFKGWSRSQVQSLINLLQRLRDASQLINQGEKSQ